MESLVLSHRLGLEQRTKGNEDKQDTDDVESINEDEEKPDHEDNTNNGVFKPESRTRSSTATTEDNNDGVASFLKFSIQNILQQHAAASDRSVSRCDAKNSHSNFGCFSESHKRAAAAAAAAAAAFQQRLDSKEGPETSTSTTLTSAATSLTSSTPTTSSSLDLNPTMANLPLW